MKQRTIALATAGLREPSSTRLLADQIAEAVRRELELRDVQVEVTVVEVREHAHALVNSMLTGFPSKELEQAIAGVTEADGLIAVTPIFSASYSGLFKSFFDVLDKEALVDKPVLLAATGGTARHSLALEHVVRPLFAYLRAVVVPTAVYAASEDWGGSTEQGRLASRVDRAARELATLVAERESSGPADPFEEPTPFAQLLAGVNGG